MPTHHNSKMKTKVPVAVPTTSSTGGPIQGRLPRSGVTAETLKPSGWPTRIGKSAAASAAEDWVEAEQEMKALRF
jgi:hypothetical protein